MNELTILLDAQRRRRQHFSALLAELGAALEAYIPAPPPPKPRIVSTKGYREVGVARFKATRVVNP